MRFMKPFYGFCQNIGTREEQQDSFGFSDLENSEFIGHGGRLSIVCDGMGGLQNGQEASQRAVLAFREAYMAKEPEESIPDALNRAAHYANEQVLTMARRFGQEENCGSTLVAAVLRNNFLCWISVGDSHIYLCRGRELLLLNREHIYANKLDAAVRRGQISEEDALAHPEREALTSYIGIPELTETDSGSLDGVPPGAGVMLCSDGLFRVLSDREMSDVFDPDPQQWAENLVRAALAKGRAHQDNITVSFLLRKEEKHDERRPANREKRRNFIAGGRRLLIAGVLVAGLLLAGFLSMKYRPGPVVSEDKREMQNLSPEAAFAESDDEKPDVEGLPHPAEEGKR
jgi:protein phosphatase